MGEAKTILGAAAHYEQDDEYGNRDSDQPKYSPADRAACFLGIQSCFHEIFLIQMVLKGANCYS